MYQADLADTDGVHDINKNLQGYNLPSDSLMDIKRLLGRRFRSPFSEGLSPEGRLAMQQVLENESTDTSLHRSHDKTLKGMRTDRSKKRHKEKDDSKRKRTISFSDSYRKSATSRFGGDITDGSFDEMSQKRRGIGGKPETALETVEIVTHGEHPSEDDIAIEETAKLNSVEKCLVWMEVNDDVTDDEARDSPQISSRTTKSSLTK